MIFICSKNIDDFVNQVIDCLDEDFLRLGNLDDCSLNLTHDSIKQQLQIITYFSNDCDLYSVEKVWINTEYSHSSFNSSEYDKDCNSLLINSFLNSKFKVKLGEVLIENNINKISCLNIARRIGFEIPETIITENKSDLLLFHKKHVNKHGIICKRITDDYYYRFGEFVYDFNITFQIDNQLLSIITEKFSLSKFQERIKPEYEVRVIYIDGLIYSTAIFNFTKNEDYRLNFDKENSLRIIPYKLPEEIEEKINLFFKYIKTNTGSIDLIYSNNKYYFLELNTFGQISFINLACNYYLEYLVSKILQNEKAS